MDDKRLEHLLKLALEAEDLDRAGSRPELRLVSAGRPRPWLLPVAGVMAAAAAAVAVVTVVLPAAFPARPAPGFTGTRSPTHEEIATTGDFSTPLRSASNEEASVVLAFFEGYDGRCTCLHIQDKEWNSDQLATKDRDELLDVAFRSRCSAPAPKLLVVGISGRRDTLPRTPEQAEALAAQLSGHPTGSRGDLVSYAYEAVPNLPTGSTIVAESVGNRSSILEQARFSVR